MCSLSFWWNAITIALNTRRLTFVYRRSFTLPVTGASEERSFSKLKRINNYLRTKTMFQEWLVDLSLTSIEH